MLVGAIQFYPLIKYTPFSPRAAGHDWETATSFPFRSRRRSTPTCRSSPGSSITTGGETESTFHSDYFGAVTLFLMGAAFGASRWMSFKRFWVGAAIVSLLWAFGGHTPLYHLIILIPGNDQFRAPSTMIYVTAFSVAVLAAIGTQRILARQVGPKYAPAWAIAGGVFALFLSIGENIG